MTPILGIMASSISGSKAIAGDYDSIASSTPTGTTTVTFSSIPATYKHLQIRINALTASAGDNIGFRFNGDTGANYANHLLAGDGAAATVDGQTGRTEMRFDVGLVSTSTTIPLVGVIDVIDYASTTKNKTVRILEGSDRNGSGEIALVSNLWKDLSAVTSISLYTVAFNFSSGTTISLYGIKG